MKHRTQQVNKKGNNPTYNYFAATLWPVSTTPATLAGFLKKWVNDQFGNKNSSLPIGKYFVGAKNSGLAEWRKNLFGMKTSDMIASGSSNSVSSERQQLMMYHSNQLISVADYSYEYTGGNHGNYGTSYATLDIIKMKHLKLDDIFTPIGKQQLGVLLDAAVRAQI